MNKDPITTITTAKDELFTKGSSIIMNGSTYVVTGEICRVGSGGTAFTIRKLTRFERWIKWPLRRFFQS